MVLFTCTPLVIWAICSISPVLASFDGGFVSQSALLDAPTFSSDTYEDVAIHTIAGFPSLRGSSQDPLFGARVDWNKAYTILAVGSPYYGATSQGAIFVYDSSYQLLWSLQGEDGEGIGVRFSLSKTWIAIGRRSTIEIYEAATGTRMGLSIASQLGNDVALVNDSLLIIGEDRDTTRQGRIRILHYEKDSGTWLEDPSIPGPFTEGRFGWVVIANDNGDRIVVSSPNASPDLIRQGTVLVMEQVNNQWTQIGPLLVGTVENAQFGFSVAMSGDGNTIVVGSPGTDYGGVYCFQLDTTQDSWKQIGSTIFAKETGMRFGRSVAVTQNGQRIAATSFVYDSHRGHARVLDLVRGEWITTKEIEGTHQLDRLGYGNFGLSLSADGSILTVGAVWANTTNGERTGEVQVVDLDSVTLTGTDSPSKFPNPSTVPSGTPSIHRSSNPSETPIETPSESSTASPSLAKDHSPSVLDEVEKGYTEFVSHAFSLSSIPARVGALCAIILPMM